MAEALTFNTPSGNPVARKMLIAFLNVATESPEESPVWAPLGVRVEDSSQEYDWGEESLTDILGDTRTTYKAPVITQTFDPWTLDASDKAQLKVWNQSIRDQDTGAMANNDMLIVHKYAGTANTAVFAERYSSCAVKPSGLGGSATVDMPIDVTYGGTRTVGTASISGGTVTFNKGASL